eukprot:4846553-Amphidinium_carterae.1
MALVDAYTDMSPTLVRQRCKELGLQVKKADSLLVLRGLLRHHDHHVVPHISISPPTQAVATGPKTKVHLRFMAWNVNSFEQRVGEIAEKAERLKLDAMFLSETQAKASSALKIAGFTLVARYDRQGVKAGGAAFYVRSHAEIQYDLLPSWCTLGIHVLCVRVWKKGASFNLAGAYFVP